MNDPWNWNESDLKFLIANKEKESLILDYKASSALASSDGKKNELSKDVSAFANSAGGTLVYGIQEDGHFPVSIDSGSDPAVISKEWIEQVISSRIQRRVTGIRINQLELTTVSPGRVAYVISIPQSQDAPHQASDKRFYKRFNFESVAMEEYEVRDMAKRAAGPDLTIDFEAKPSSFGSNSFEIWPLVTNHSLAPAEYVQVTIFLDQRLRLLTNVTGLHDGGDFTLDVNDVPTACRRYYSNYGIQGKLPIFKGLHALALDGPLNVGFDNPGRYILAWSLASPYAENKVGAVVATFDGQNVTFDDGDNGNSILRMLNAIVAKLRTKS